VWINRWSQQNQVSNSTSEAMINIAALALAPSPIRHAGTGNIAWAVVETQDNVLNCIEGAALSRLPQRPTDV
jgi:hypothetical protein